MTRLLETRQGLFAQRPRVTLCRLAITTLLGHDKSKDARQSINIAPPDDRRCTQAVTPDQHAFNFHRRDPLARRLETIVAAAHMPPEAFLVAPVKIAGAHPAIDKRRYGNLRPLPVT